MPVLVMQGALSSIFGSPCKQAAVGVQGRTIYWTCGMTLKGAFGCQGLLLRALLYCACPTGAFTPLNGSCFHEAIFGTMRKLKHQIARKEHVLR